MGDTKSNDRVELTEAAAKLNQTDIEQLVNRLSEKADDLRYQALLLLQYRSRQINDVYPYWELFHEKLKSDNSYQRNIGLTLIAENARWDSNNKLATILDDYLLLLKDEKPITIRLCIQALENIITCKPEYHAIITDRLLMLDLYGIRETMRKLILMDIIKILLKIKKDYNSTALQNYINDALLGEILDKKSKKEIEMMLI